MSRSRRLGLAAAVLILGLAGPPALSQVPPQPPPTAPTAEETTQPADVAWLVAIAAGPVALAIVLGYGIWRRRRRRPGAGRTDRPR